MRRVVYRGLHVSGVRAACLYGPAASVATGGGVSALFLDDDSLVVARVIGRLHHLLFVVTFPLRIRRHAHAVLVRLKEIREEGTVQPTPEHGCVIISTGAMDPDTAASIHMD